MGQIRVIKSLLGVFSPFLSNDEGSSKRTKPFNVEIEKAFQDGTRGGSISSRASVCRA